MKHRKINNQAKCICGSAMSLKKYRWICPVAEEEKPMKVVMEYPLILTNENSKEIETTCEWDLKVKVYRVNVRLRK